MEIEKKIVKNYKKNFVYNFFVTFFYKLLKDYKNIFEKRKLIYIFFVLFGPKSKSSLIN